MVRNIGFAVTLAALATLPSLAQVPPRCLHGPDERADHRARREQALMLAEQINRAENNGPVVAPLQQRRYRPFEQLAGMPPTPSGFKVQFNTDGATYAFSIKDTTDPCRYAVFSDQEQGIYEGVARREAVTVRPTDLP